MHTTIEHAVERENAIIRRGLWIVGFIVATGIGISGFSIAWGLFVA